MVLACLKGNVSGNAGREVDGVFQVENASGLGGPSWGR